MSPAKIGVIVLLINVLLGVAGLIVFQSLGSTTVTATTSPPAAGTTSTTAPPAATTPNSTPNSTPKPTVAPAAGAPVTTPAVVTTPAAVTPSPSTPPLLVSQPLKWAGGSGQYTRYLDCDGGACTKAGNRVQIYTGSGAAGQAWTWRNNGLYSGTELLATANNGTANETPVVATPDTGAGGTGGQAWVWLKNADGGWQLQNPASQRCLDIAGGVDADRTIAQLWDCQTSSSRWKPVPWGQ